MTKASLVFAAVGFALAVTATAIGLNQRPQSPAVDHSRTLVIWSKGRPHAEACSAPGGLYLSPCALIEAR
jgi:hypothetical protein